MLRVFSNAVERPGKKSEQIPTKVHPHTKVCSKCHVILRVRHGHGSAPKSFFSTQERMTEMCHGSQHCFVYTLGGTQVSCFDSWIHPKNSCCWDFSTAICHQWDVIIQITLITFTRWMPESRVLSWLCTTNVFLPGTSSPDTRPVSTWPRQVTYFWWFWMRTQAESLRWCLGLHPKHQFIWLVCFFTTRTGSCLSRFTGMTRWWGRTRCVQNSFLRLSPVMITTPQFCHSRSHRGTSPFWHCTGENAGGLCETVTFADTNPIGQWARRWRHGCSSVQNRDNGKWIRCDEYWPISCTGTCARVLFDMPLTI